MVLPDQDLLIIGARSLIGRRLREIAPAAWGDGVWCTSRQPLAGQSLVLDVQAPENFRPEAQFATVIICLPIWLVTEALLRRLTDLGMKRLVAFSSTSRFTKDASDSREEREVAGRLAAGEKTVMAFCTANAVAWTILRPTLIYDEGHDENVTRIASLIRKVGFFPVCAPANGLRQPVHARDLAHAALKAAIMPAAHDKAYNVPGGESLTYQAMVGRIFAALGRKPVIMALPQGLWRLGFAALDLLRPRRALKRNINMVLRMNEDLWFDAVPAVTDFAYAPGPFRPDFTSPASTGS